MFLSVGKACSNFLWGERKKPLEERAIAQNPAKPTPSLITELDDDTLMHLGVSSINAPVLKKLLGSGFSLLVRSETYKRPHVTEWLEQRNTQLHLQRLAHARLTTSAESSDDYAALVESYMTVSGEHRSFAENIVEQTVKVFVAGVLGAVKDPGVGALIGLSTQALQQRFDEFDELLKSQALPELGWSVERACDENAAWLQQTFSNQATAKSRLGQLLCPADQTLTMRSLPRDEQTQQLRSLLDSVPAGGAVALIGDEGNGKSWLAAQTWLSLPNKPLTLFVTAEEFEEDDTNPAEFLVRQLCIQTGRGGNVRHQDFWSSELTKWHTQGRGPAQGILVVLDGLNQRPQRGWARLIERLGLELEGIGGKLLLTSRPRFFYDRVKPLLIMRCSELAVPEWRPEERDVLLGGRNIRSEELNASVASALCNPRLLGVALSLLDSAQLQAMEELSISLLLFEHLRASQHDTYDNPARYSRMLQENARQVLERLSAQQRDDLTVFDGGLEAVVEGHFFVPLAEDSTRYSLSEEGLGLALGLAILEELHKAKRNKRDLDEALAKITEPISALDQTAQAVLAALTMACMDSVHSDEIGVAILRCFAGLQNPGECVVESITALARTRPQVFLGATKTLALQGGVAVNFDWIQLALHHAKADPQSWRTIAQAIEGWLHYVSLQVEKQARMLGHSDQEVERHRAKLQTELQAKQATLTQAERDLLATLTHISDHDVAVLSLTAIKLLAGMPLASFSSAFVAWGFAQHLNGSYETPYKEFRQLIRFNSVDWLVTRNALLLACQSLQKEKPSRVGQWTLVTVLQATGNEDDARLAQALVTELRAGQAQQSGWRLIETYCSTDPCDPTNIEPDNVASTATQYAAIDVANLGLQLGMTQLDMAFNDARPAVARYYPEIAVERHRAWADDVLHRSGLPLRQGVIGLLDHACLITSDQAQHFARRVCGSAAEREALCSLGDEAVFWAQFQLGLAFPWLTAMAQLDALLQGRFGDKLMVSLSEKIQPLDSASFHTRLTAAMAEQDVEALAIVLLFAPFANQALPPELQNLVPTLLSSPSTLVRANILRVVVHSGDAAALRLVVQHGWSAGQLEETQHRERWYGSQSLLEAAVQAVAPWDHLVDRIDHFYFGQFAHRVGGDAARHIAFWVDAWLQRALRLPVEVGVLGLEVVQDMGRLSPKPLSFRLSEQEPLNADLKEALNRAQEGHERFAERQRTLRAKFDDLLASLTRVNADSLLDPFDLDGVGAIAAANPDLAERWCDLLLERVDGSFLATARNLALLLARATAARAPDRAVQLFQKFDPIKPLVRVVFGQSGIELAVMAVWASPDSIALNQLRFQRLDDAPNNDALADEVWAALRHGKLQLLRDYIDERLLSTWPVAQARAVMAAGLMGVNPSSTLILARFNGKPGLLGETQGIAQAAYDRHAWACHWLNCMRTAATVETFWSAAALFLVVADGRVEALGLAMTGTPSTVFTQYWPSVERQLSGRFQKLRQKHKDRLLSDEAPWPPFLMRLESAPSAEAAQAMGR